MTLPTSPDYSAAWRDLRRRRIIFYAVWVGYVPAVFAIYYVALRPLLHVFMIKEDYLVLPVAGLWMVAFLVAGIRVQLFRCPRCHQWFFAKWYSNPFTRKCLHCGLPRGAKTG
jgi:hypothetical protein